MDGSDGEYVRNKDGPICLETTSLVGFAEAAPRERKSLVSVDTPVSVWSTNIVGIAAAIIVLSFITFPTAKPPSQSSYHKSWSRTRQVEQGSRRRKAGSRDPRMCSRDPVEVDTYCSTVDLISNSDSELAKVECASVDNRPDLLGPISQTSLMCSFADESRPLIRCLCSARKCQRSCSPLHHRSQILGTLKPLHSC
jgi:hypothetical protein